jgi:hypothetical protein
MDVAFVCLSVTWYALLPVHTSTMRDERSSIRENLIEGDEVELDVRGPDRLPRGNPFGQPGREGEAEDAA